MMRLYYDIMDRLYLVLVWLKYRNGARLHNIERDVVNWYRDSGTSVEERSNIRMALDTYRPGSDEHEIDGLLSLFNKVMNNRRNEVSNQEGDLIDLLVRTLQLPYVSPTLSGSTLNNLKKALLLPEEMAGLRQRLMKSEMSCCSCGRAFGPSEAVVHILSQTDREPTTLLCLMCAKPEYAKCGQCGETVPFGDVYATKRSKGCEGHKKETSEQRGEGSPFVFSAASAELRDTGFPRTVSIRGGRRGGGIRAAGFINTGRPTIAPPTPISETPQQAQQDNGEGRSTTNWRDFIITSPSIDFVSAPPTGDPNVPITVANDDPGIISR